LLLKWHGIRTFTFVLLYLMLTQPRLETPLDLALLTIVLYWDNILDVLGHSRKPVRRNWLHSFALPIILAKLFRFVPLIPDWFPALFALVYLGHLFYDMLTAGGVFVLPFFSYRVSLGKCKNDSPLVLVILVLEISTYVFLLSSYFVCSLLSSHYALLSNAKRFLSLASTLL